MSLGLWIEVRPSDDVTALCARVANMGYSALHVHFPARCDTALAQRVAHAAAAYSLAISAVSGYASMVRPAAAPMGYTLAQLHELIALLPLLGTRYVVCWAGTLAEDLLAEHPANRSAAAHAQLSTSLAQLLPALDVVDGVLLIEPFCSHILGNVAELAQFIEHTNSPYLGLVLDPPNLMLPQSWASQRTQIDVMVQRLAPYIGLVHLKDMRLEGDNLELPGPGGGVLDYAAFLGALERYAISAPRVVEHVSLDTAAAARAFVLGNKIGVG
ncbi:sugar phosphate isomerase/epimerase [Candidatus Gracilibacteria bacterium]|nr:sugar phosphate isomerase/epimerase [Candidatus Gracilibacteria bacterium]